MWVLQNQKDKSKYFLPCNKTITVGRKDADLLIIGDSSISRKHATIYVSIPTTDIDKLSAHGKVVLEDVSKFGTHVDREGSKKTDKCMDLQNGDIIEFGVQGSLFKLYHERFNVAVSMVDKVLKSEILEALVTIGGKIVDGWHHNIDYLVIKTIKLNLKVVKALVTPCHIVSPEYVYNIRDQVSSQVGQVLFEPAKYLPMLDEPALSSKNCNLQVDMSRRKIFCGKTFIFISKKQLKRMHNIIVAAGGEVIFLHEDAGLTDEYAAKANVCFITCAGSNIKDGDWTNAKLDEICEFVKSMNRRVIDEYEIGLAILYCDASVYCNPACDFKMDNVFAYGLDIHSPKEISSLSKSSSCILKTESLKTTSKIHGMASKRQLEILSCTPTLLDEEMGDVSQAIHEPDRMNDGGKDDFTATSTISSLNVKDSTLEHSYHQMSSKFPPEFATSAKQNRVRVQVVNEPPLSQESSAPTMCRHSSRAIPELNNFKKFRKTWPTYMAIHMPQNSAQICPKLPKVIGGNDFFGSSRSSNENRMSQGEFNAEQQDSNPFRRE